jgi:lactate dehydrogenase-like 2-hydroxyacid dehydrogenase
VLADSKEGKDSDLDKYLPEADIVITTPFHPGYINAERIAKAPKLKLALTAGIGSDHVDLPAAAEHGVTVAEITGRHPNWHFNSCESFNLGVAYHCASAVGPVIRMSTMLLQPAAQPVVQTLPLCTIMQMLEWPHKDV